MLRIKVSICVHNNVDILSNFKPVCVKTENPQVCEIFNLPHKNDKMFNPGIIFEIVGIVCSS